MRPIAIALVAVSEISAKDTALLGTNRLMSHARDQPVCPPAEGAIGILYAKEVADQTKADEVAKKSEEYKQEIMTPTIAAKRGYISEVIQPEDTRKYVVNSFEMLENKTSMDKPLKKHGNIPL